jgi:hypothetical protein
LLIAVGWLVVLVGLFFIWILTPSFREQLPKLYGHNPGIPVEVPWFGAIGGLAASLGGIAFYGHGGWSDRFNYWHPFKPALGAITGGVSCLLLVVILRAGTGNAKITTDPTTFDASAFVFGYAEEAFRELIRAVTNIFIKPADKPQSNAAEPKPNEPGPPGPGGPSAPPVPPHAPGPTPTPAKPSGPPVSTEPDASQPTQPPATDTNP